VGTYQGVEQLHGLPDTHRGPGLLKGLAAGLEVERYGLLGVLLAAPRSAGSRYLVVLPHSHVEPAGALVGVHKLPEPGLVLLRVELGLAVRIGSFQLGDVDVVDGVRDLLKLEALGVCQGEQLFKQRQWCGGGTLGNEDLPSGRTKSLG
jgi:hypothetical protein